MVVPDPITPLTPAEQALVDWLNLFSSRDEVLSVLKADLQTAIEIELATIPIYLYTYYSLDRNADSGEQIDDAQLYVNKAGGVIMSVVVEEMLHMSLSSNILFALGGAPQLYGKAPAAYPTGLPYHKPNGAPGPNGATAVSIPLAKLSFEQLWHFLQIEYPEKFDTFPQDRNWTTIGQFYSFIRCLINTSFITDADFQHGAQASAIQPYNYSPNNVDTVYPRARFDAWKPAPPAVEPAWAQPDTHPGGAAAAVFADADDSHAGPAQLVTVNSVNSAAQAIDTICDQGEGQASLHGPEATDDPSKSELSHYYKFLTLQAQFAEYPGTTEGLPAQPKPPLPVTPTVSEKGLAKFVYNFPDNPVAAKYPEALQPIAAFCSACFQYMLIMTETIYRVPPQSQKLFFNQALHRSMIWVLDKYIRTIREIPITEGDYAGYRMAPTFENVDLGPRETSFAALKSYGERASAAAAHYAAAHPDQASTMANVSYYVSVAISKTGSDGHAMHLPDVGPYWR